MWGPGMGNGWEPCEGCFLYQDSGRRKFGAHTHTHTHADDHHLRNSRADDEPGLLAEGQEVVTQQHGVLLLVSRQQRQELLPGREEDQRDRSVEREGPEQAERERERDREERGEREERERERERDREEL